MLPSKKLEEWIEKSKVTEFNMDTEEYYHKIYAEIVKLIIETYQVARYTNWINNIDRKKLIFNLFKDYIKLQKVSLRLNEKKEVLEGYLEFSHFVADEHYYAY